MTTEWNSRKTPEDDAWGAASMAEDNEWSLDPQHGLGTQPSVAEPRERYAARRAPQSALRPQPSLAMGAHYFRVGELVTYIHELFAADPLLGDVWIAGEITELSQSAAGHVYFTIRDGDARMPAVMFRSAAQRQTLPLVAGFQALVHGAVGVYDQRSIFQLVADIVLPGDAGKLRAEFEALRMRLEREGLFAAERKRPVPRLPRRIGIVTSEAGAVLHDMLNTWERRYPHLEIVLAPARVQGEDAPRQIVAALGRLNEYHLRQMPGTGLDLIILARGGGSPEELAAFNDEHVARAIFACRVPVVSAIGHEVDYTIADLVADLRAPTATAAAQMVVPDAAALRRDLERGKERLATALRGQLAGARTQASTAQQRLERALPSYRVDAARRQIDELVARGTRCLGGLIAPARARVAAGRAQLEALNPEMILRRGYAIARRSDDGAVVTDAARLAVGDHLTIRFARGRATTQVEDLDVTEAAPEEPHARR